MNTLIRFFALFSCACAFFSCTSDGFYGVKDGHFVKDGKPYYYIGTNFWYGPILASDGTGGDYDRLTAELDTLKSLGLTNLRVCVGADGPEGVPTKVSPSLQYAPGVYNDTLLVGLDRFMVELGKRDMTAVLYVNNSWEWTGGYGMYLEWAGAGEALIPAESGYGPFVQQMSQFATNKKAQELFFEHLRFMVGRTNSVTGRPYSEDTAIFSWQIGNEPRCFTEDSAAKDSFAAWVTESAAIIKSLDHNHMVSVGSEGKMGSEGDMALYEKIHACKDIDYLTAHVWPYNWSWVRENTLTERLETAKYNTGEYIREHMDLARKLSKPLVIEEFGFPRDNMSLAPASSTSSRDEYYSFVFSLVTDSSERGDVLAGANFWGWGGFALPSHAQWRPGDDYSGDPAQEDQGLNSVFVVDRSTISVIRDAQSKLLHINN